MMDVRASFLAQGDHCSGLGSEQTARYCRHFARHLNEDSAVGRRILSWPGDPSSGSDALALRLMGGLHALVLTGADPELADLWQQGLSAGDADMARVFSRVFLTHEAHLQSWLNGPPQTNELRRSVALAAIGHWLSARYGLPLVLSELGASAGLNLYWPEWRIDVPGGHFGPDNSPVHMTPEWRGQAPVIAPPQIRDRAGADLNPLHPKQDRLRLLSYIWAGQPDRLARTEAALSHAAARPGLVTRSDAADWLEGRLARVSGPVVHLVCHTIAWQYFPEATQARITTLLEKAAARPGTILLRFGMERDDSGGAGAAMTLHDPAAGRAIPFGRVDFHGRWIDWQPAALQGGTP
ncbi:DUF2332 domain-containing protein [Falsigemmobacter faecalis]|uniref:DUF2332 family protein n=1 Tax=Falsigemmobacter faecalis TaxID=2488730 RepID=A0A3P3DR19_9RHOB|nr:DUF2332 family protein [Falsigemmobacter faecalis]RRH76384.1 DUF2332 family protein [Falsigemmobacter faecalis]